MKNSLLSILFALLAGTGAVFAQSEVTPPAFNGAVIRVFMTRMAATVEKIAIEQQIPADSISPVVGIALQIDKAGNVAEWRYMDNTQEGRDHAEFAPATAATRRAMEKAYDRLGGTWSPATLADGSPVSYTSRMTIRIPVEKIRRAQDADPLLFMGENPDENFHAWAKMRIRYDGRFTEKGVPKRRPRRRPVRRPVRPLPRRSAAVFPASAQPPAGSVRQWPADRRNWPR